VAGVKFNGLLVSVGGTMFAHLAGPGVHEWEEEEYGPEDVSDPGFDPVDHWDDRTDPWKEG
jgi:hypothetical protein